jgi:hypothetical protein
MQQDRGAGPRRFSKFCPGTVLIIAPCGAKMDGPWLFQGARDQGLAYLRREFGSDPLDGSDRWPSPS